MFTTKPTPGRILDFDLENRPLSYWYDGQCTAEVTAFGWCWVGEGPVNTLLLLHDGTFVDDEGIRYPPRKAYELFLAELYQADLVTGHYIRRHDLPILNAMLMDLDMPGMDKVQTSDTKLDLIKRKDLATSQEALAAMLGLPEPKHHMTQEEWREANRLTEAGLEFTRKRVTDDVIQHMALRAALLERGWLKPPRTWSP